MTGWSDLGIWSLIATLGVATYLIRFSFLGLIGDRTLPDWVLRHLRYTPVAILPALVTPAVLWPADAGGQISAPHIIAACAAVAMAYWRGNAVYGVIVGMAIYLLLSRFF